VVTGATEVKKDLRSFEVFGRKRTNHFLKIHKTIEIRLVSLVRERHV